MDSEKYKEYTLEQLDEQINKTNSQTMKTARKILTELAKLLNSKYARIGFIESNLKICIKDYNTTAKFKYKYINYSSRVAFDTVKLPKNELKTIIDSMLDESIELYLKLISNKKVNQSGLELVMNPLCKQSEIKNNTLYLNSSTTKLLSSRDIDKLIGLFSSNMNYFVRAIKLDKNFNINSAVILKYKNNIYLKVEIKSSEIYLNVTTDNSFEISDKDAIAKIKIKLKLADIVR